MKKLTTDEDIIKELIDDEGAFLQGSDLNNNTFIKTNNLNRGDNPPPTSASHARETGQDPSSRLHYGGFGISESEIKEDIVQDRGNSNSLLEKNSDILSLKDIEELYNERFLVSEVEKLVKDINELWSKYDEEQRDLNQIKTSIIYHILNNTNVNQMPSKYRNILKKSV